MTMVPYVVCCAVGDMTTAVLLLLERHEVGFEGRPVLYFQGPPLTFVDVPPQIV